MKYRFFILIILFLTVQIKVTFSYFDIPVAVQTVEGKEYRGKMFSTRFPPYGKLKGKYEGDSLEISLLIVKRIEILGANPKTIEVIHLGSDKKIRLTDAEFSLDPYLDTDIGRIIFPWKKIKIIDLWVDLQKCPSCGVTMLNDWFFCPFDGTKLPSVEKIK